MRILLGVLAAIGCSTVPAHAQSGSLSRFLDSNGKMDRTYQILFWVLDSTERAVLVRSQRLWVQFRDMDCAVGGIRKLDCLAAHSKEREEQLDAYVFAFGRRKAAIAAARLVPESR